MTNRPNHNDSPRRNFALAATALATAAVLGAGAWGCGRAGEQAPRTVVLERTTSSRAEIPAAAIAADVGPVETDASVAALEQLRSSGRFDQFAAATRQAAEAEAANAAVRCLLVEAQLSTGDNEGAAQTALVAARLALDAEQPPLAVRALRLWIVARLRLGQPLDDEIADALLEQLPADQEGAPLVRYWMTAFRNRQPYELGATKPARVELASTKAADGTIWADLNAVEVTTNGVVQPMVFIDTGAQQTIMTLRAAEMAGVQLGEGVTELTGFARLEARPAVLDTLDLGGLVLHNVPVLVGNAPALMSAKGQMALGAELMHHVRFTLDYPARKVFAEHATMPVGSESARTEIPLWTFSQACLVQAETDRGGARAMIDTGNRWGTYLSARWARHHLPQFERPTSTMVFKFRRQDVRLAKMELGALVLSDWPVWDRIPRHLEQLDLVDVLVGRDLLWPYRLEIDLNHRVMRIEGGPDVPAPPPEPMP